MKKNRIIHTTNKLLKYYTVIAALLFTIFILLSFTTLPFWMYYHLGTSAKKLVNPPEFIVIMGGGGMPSKSGLIRTYYTAMASKNYPDAKIIIALPGDTTDTTSSVYLMKKELTERGINQKKILFESKGTNTRSQAIEISKRIDSESSVLIITSPEHLYRTVKAFEKVGLINSGGIPAFEKAIEASLIFNDKELGGNKNIPDIGNNTQLRYQFWNHMKYQIIVYREYFAIAYYKTRQWN